MTVVLTTGCCCSEGAVVVAAGLDAVAVAAAGRCWSFRFVVEVSGDLLCVCVQT